MISIIIPTLNEEKTIGNTLESLRRLSYCDYEIIISDGKSKDRTIEIAKKYGAKIIIYKGATRQTIGGGRNLGASIASGEFFVFLDADVIIPDINNFFTKAINIFKNQKELVGLTVCIKVLPELETLPDRVIFSMINYLNFFLNNVFHWGNAGGEFQMIRASVFRKLKGYNKKLVAGEDNDMFQRLTREGKTRIEMSPKVMHTGRRAHKIGWPRLLLTWYVDWLSVLLFNRSFSTIWKEVR